MTMQVKLDNLQTDAFDVRDDSDEDNFERFRKTAYNYYPDATAPQIETWLLCGR